MITPSKVKKYDYIICLKGEDGYLTKGRIYRVMRIDTENSNPIAVWNNYGDDWYVNNKDFDFYAKYDDRLMKTGDQVVLLREHSYMTEGQVYKVIEDQSSRGSTVVVKDNDGDRLAISHYFVIPKHLHRDYSGKIDTTFRPINGLIDYRASRGDYEGLLSKAGFERIGSGSFGAVYAKPDSDVVLKTGRLHDGWLAYAKLAMTSQKNNPHVPKIHWIKFFGDNEHRWYLAKMERLVPLKNQKLFDVASNIIRDEAIKDPRAREGYVKFRRKQPQLLSLIETIQETVLKDYSRDFHHGNVMERKDGTFVITDPAAGALKNAAQKRRERKKSRAARSLSVLSSERPSEAVEEGRV